MMNQEIFDTEIALCKGHAQKKGGCKWGECEKCGVVPLLYKLCKNELIDDEDEIAKLKEGLL
jgi:hypothetical protein